MSKEVTNVPSRIIFVVVCGLFLEYHLLRDSLPVCFQNGKIESTGNLTAVLVAAVPENPVITGRKSGVTENRNLLP